MIKIPVEPPITEYLHKKAAKMKIPLNGTFELTPLCNMDCRMCYVRMSKEQQEKISPLYTASEWIKLGADAKERGMMYLLLTGGEPFLRSDFKNIMQGLHKMGFVITINSNGTLIDEEVISWLKETPPVRINITLYGASDATYERLCRNPKGFTMVTKAIRLLKEAGILVKLNCSLTPYNVCDLEEMFAFAKKEGLVLQATSYMFPPLRRDEKMIGKNNRFTEKEAAYYAAKIDALQKGEDNFVQYVKAQNWENLKCEHNNDCIEIENNKISCRAGKCSFWVTWDGKMYPCGMINGEKACNVFQTGFDRAWDVTQQMAEEICLPSKCSNCGLKGHCRACAAMALTESGKFTEVPKYRCRMMQAYPESCQIVAEEILNSKAGDHNEE